MDSERTPSEAVRVAVQLAQRFHETYERLAPSFGYETRAETKVFDPESPNGKLMIAVCAALSLHVGDAALDVEAMLAACVPGGDHCDPQQVADALRAYLGASASPTGLCGLRPEPQSVSALRAPIPGAEAMSREVRMAVMLAYGHLWHVNNEPMAPIPMYLPEKAAYAARRQLRDLLTTQERGEAINQVGFLIGRYDGVDAQAIVTREGQDPQGLGGEAIERGPAGVRPEASRAQPFLHIEPAPGHRWIQATMEEWDEVQRIRDAATTPTEGPAQTLTDEEIDAVVRMVYGPPGLLEPGELMDLREFARAVEARLKERPSVE